MTDILNLQPYPLFLAEASWADPATARAGAVPGVTVWPVVAWAVRDAGGTVLPMLPTGEAGSLRVYLGNLSGHPYTASGVGSTPERAAAAATAAFERQRESFRRDASRVRSAA